MTPTNDRLPRGGTGTEKTPTNDREPDCGKCVRCMQQHPDGAFPPREARFMVLCPDCGNKRCPRAQWHGYECTRSNEPDQVPRVANDQEQRQALERLASAILTACGNGDCGHVLCYRSEAAAIRGVTRQSDREPRGEQTPGEMTVEQAKKILESRDQSWCSAQIDAALRTLLREHERLNSTWLARQYLALERKLASAVCAGCGHATVHDRGVAVHWCEECMAAAIEAAIRERDEARAENEKVLSDLENTCVLLEKARAELDRVPDRGHGPLLSEDDHLAVEEALRERVAELESIIASNNEAACQIAQKHKQAERDLDAATKAKDLLRHDLEFTIYSMQVEHAKALSAVEAERDEAIQSRDIAAETAALCARQAEQAEADAARLRKALSGLGKRRQFDELCFCSTIAGLYCVGQERCKAAQAALAKDGQ